jgi:hypothetical protein
MRKIFWLLTLFSTILGGLYVFYVLLTATTPAQQTAGLALALATVGIPYVFTRCLEGVRHADIMRVRIVGQERPRERPPVPTDPRTGEPRPAEAPEPTVVDAPP